MNDIKLIDGPELWESLGAESEEEYNAILNAYLEANGLRFIDDDEI